MCSPTVSRRVYLSLVGCLVGGCFVLWEDRKDADTAFDKNKGLFAAIKKADQLTLYEGLPHQGNEPKVFAEEMRTKNPITLHGHPFYRTPLEVPAADKDKLHGLLGDEVSFAQFGGEKKCGGFHPDYLAEWKVGEAKYQVLICLGCHEVKVYGPDASLRADIQGEAYKKLVELLKAYRKNRPASREE